MNETQHPKKGTLEVICGSMFSGKSEELIHRVKRSQLAAKKILVLKPSMDNRTSMKHVTSHSGQQIEAIPVSSPALVKELATSDIDVVGIDEVQFFEPGIIAVICALIDQGKRVIVAGLDLDFRGKPFGPMPILMAVADKVTKLKAICMCCSADAHFTQRLVNGCPAKYDDPLILIGAQESYQARCRNCHSIDRAPEL